MKKELHLANSVLALNDLAKKNIRNIKPHKLYNSAEKVFQSGLQKLNEGDEETSYILFVRFTLIYKYLDESSDDKRYTKQRLGREYTTASEQLNKLESSLKLRYERQTKEVTPVILDIPKPEIKHKDPVIEFPSGYITCNELFILINKKIDIVILDARPREYYLQSSMKHPCCVNIPEEIIQSGSSANTLGREVPNESKSQWNRRWNSSVTVLLDWSSTKETITASKLSVLKDILMLWDTTMIDSKTPIVLNGGYLEWLQMYPMHCINPDVVYEVQNSVLNDLLDLDSIEYPSAEETMPARYLKPPSLQPVIDRATKPILVDKEKNIIKQNENATDLDELRTKRNLEAEEGMRFELQQREEKLLEDKAALEKSKQELNDENEQLRKKLQSINDNSVKSKEISSKEEIDIREKLLLEAREKKKNLVSNTIKNQTRTKKKELERKMRGNGNSGNPGQTGLTNLGSTCYMNSVLQCYSNTRILNHYFVLYWNAEDHKIEKNKRYLMLELRDLLVKLWTGGNKCITPYKFKAMVDHYGPRYKGREQQDAHEFLISLNTWLHEELRQDIKRPIQVIWTPKQHNWVTKTEGSASIILETFCGQQLNIISCDECKKRKEKLEVFEHLALALPTHGSCTLENCLNQYYSKQQIDDYKCQTCDTTKTVNMEMKLVGYPPVLVLCLKRFSEGKIDAGVYNFVKNIVSVKYPLINLNLFGVSYNLYGVIVHRTCGVTLNSGHYFAIIKNVWNGIWYKYDDQHVTEVNCNEALEPTDAYILFYQTQNEEQLCRNALKNE